METHDDFFFEGAWAGDFTQGDLLGTEVVFGSGAVWGDTSDGTLWFVPSLATTDYLFYRTTGSAITIANSLALLLAALGDALRPDTQDYVAINRSIMNGIEAHHREIPTQHGNVRRLMYHNLRIDANSVTEVNKPHPPEFPDFDTYARYLSDSYAALAANARDTARTTPLRIYTTQSRGYDSTAVNAIAAPHGIDAVMTVTRGKPGRVFSDDREINDDGTEISHLLGMHQVAQLTRRPTWGDDETDELYFYAGIHDCQDANLRQVAEHMTAPALLLTGTLGEPLVYARRMDPASITAVPGTRTPTSLRLPSPRTVSPKSVSAPATFRFRCPISGARRRADILRITESPEMDPWRLGVAYDRPIPRRLGEAAGVPRDAFGQKKAGSVIAFTPPQFPGGATLRRRYGRVPPQEPSSQRRAARHAAVRASHQRDARHHLRNAIPRDVLQLSHCVQAGAARHQSQAAVAGYSR